MILVAQAVAAATSVERTSFGNRPGSVRIERVALYRRSPSHQLRQLGDVGGDAPRLIAREPLPCVTVGLALEADCRQSSKCMRRLAKQFELGGRCRDTQIRFGAREVGLICV